MALDSYSALKASVADWLNRADLTTQIPDFITVLEAKLRRRHQVELVTVATIALDAETVALPATCKNVLSLYFDDGVRQGEIEISTPEFNAGQQGRVHNLTTGVPQKAAIINNGTTLELTPTPDQTYPAKIIYVEKLVSLSAAEPLNWLLDEHSDVYLKGTLMQAEEFLKNDARVPLWKQDFEEALAELQLFIQRRKVGNTLIQRPRRAIP